MSVICLKQNIFTQLHTPPKWPHPPPPGFAWLLRSGHLAAMCSAWQRHVWDPPNCVGPLQVRHVFSRGSFLTPPSHMMWRSTRGSFLTPRSTGTTGDKPPRHHGWLRHLVGLRPPGLTLNPSFFGAWASYVDLLRKWGFAPLLRSQVAWEVGS